MNTSCTILVVEDNALVAKFYRMALERAGGFACILSENVGEILAAVKAGRIDLAILDVSLSQSEWEGHPIDGVDLARLLKQHAPRRLPILLVTAHAMAGDHERLLAASGADDYFEKPIFDASLLVEKVQHLLGASGKIQGPTE